MAKRFNFKQVEIQLESGERILIECSSARMGDHTSQRAECRRFNGPFSTKFAGYAQYVNRPWEGFEYENALRELARTFDTAWDQTAGDALRAWCDKHCKEESDKAEKFVAEFQAEWAKASPSLKAAMKASGDLNVSIENAETTLAVLKMGNLLNSL